jgi:predicted nucleic-acid-binding protein
MIGLDTNVLVRYIMQDDPKQSPKATRLMASLDSGNPGYIALVRIVELYWVLSCSYGLSRGQSASGAGCSQTVTFVSVPPNTRAWHC